MLILTGFNSAFAEIGTLCVQSICRYCQTHPEARFISHLIPDDYSRPPSWFKVELIKRHLPDHDYILWIDADAMIAKGAGDLAAMLRPATLNIAKDVNGINHGVVAWRNCPEAFTALDRIESLFEEFKEHKWFEQSALMTFVDELDVFYQPKHIFNSYPKDVAGEPDDCPETMIVHYPGMKNKGRIRAMKARLAA